MKTNNAARRRRLYGVLATTALSGAVAATIAPSAGATNDPCSTSELARTLSSVTKSTADYLDSHPETDRMLTGVLQQPPDDRTVDRVNDYFDANPGVRNDLVVIGLPLAVANEQCKLAERGPALLAVFQAAQSQGKIPDIPGAPSIPGVANPAANQPAAASPTVSR